MKKTYQQPRTRYVAVDTLSLLENSRLNPIEGNEDYQGAKESFIDCDDEAI